MKIQKGKIEFLMGIDKVEQLTAWLNERPDVNGVAFVGRSNVGKSSLINALYGKSVARVSKTPGRTRQVNIFSFLVLDEVTKEEHKFYFFDVPGYGHAEVSKEMARNWEVLLTTFFRYVDQKIALLNIQDARHPLQESDELFHDYLKNFDIEVFLIFNKIDKLKTQSERANLKKLMPSIYEKFKWVRQIHFASAEKLDGVAGIEQAIISYVMRFKDNNRAFLSR